MLNAIKVTLDNDTEIVVMVSAVSRFVKTDNGTLRIYYLDGKYDTTVNSYDKIMEALYLEDAIHLVGGEWD